MNRVLSAARRYPILAYFLIAYGVSWIGIISIVGPGGLRDGDLELSRGLLVWLMMLCGPAVSGLLMTWLSEHREGLTAFRERLMRWRLPLRWYATMLVAPTSGIVVVGALWWFSGDFEPMVSAEPDKAFVVTMFFVLVFGAFVEELGWTGFATHKLNVSFSILGATLLLGSVHGSWHLLADLSGRGDVEWLLYAPRFVVFWIVSLVVLRLLMVWSYAHTESLLLGQLIHASYTAPLFLLTPLDASPAQLLLLWTAFTVVFAIVTVTFIAGQTRKQGAANPIRTLITFLPNNRKSRTG